MKKQALLSSLQGLRPYRWTLTSLVVIVLLATAIWAVRPEPHDIQVTGLPAPLAFRTTAKDLRTALESQGVHIGPKDRVQPSLDTLLKGKRELTVQIRKAVPVVVEVDGKRLEVSSAADTVQELLRELSVSLQPKDRVSVDLSTKVSPNLRLKIVRRTEVVTTIQQEIPYRFLRREDPDMNEGETQELQAGETGVKEVRQVTYLEDGKEVRSEVLEEKVVKEPVDQILAYGTVAVVSRGGVSYRYSRALEMSATGYTAGKESNPNGNGYTYTGMKAERGVVAVDPNVIPLYTRLYIEGYGPAIAGDIGGAIKGNKIDLAFDSLSEALAWGRRPVTVYILRD